MNKIKIGNKLVGENEPVFIIAEAGINHNGSLEIAKKLVKIASKAGADAVKFQTFFTDKLVTKNAPKAYHQKTSCIKESQYEMLKKLELTKKDHQKLMSYANKFGIIFLSTPYDQESADFLEELGVHAFKIASSSLTSIPFIKHIARKKKPIIISTGMATISEIDEAIQTIKKTGNKKIILLHCTSNYPAKIENVNLRAMLTLKRKFNLLVGYSDHTLENSVSIIATALGAVIIEKHFTSDKNLPGPDHKFSLNSNEFKKMINGIRMTETILGLYMKKPQKSEFSLRRLLRTSIVADVDINVGTKITSEMLAFKRPGTGLPPKYVNSVVGKKAKKYIKKDEFITFNKIE